MARANILIDSCFWIALYTPDDAQHSRALSLVDDLENNEVIIPWPTLYEFINTRLARRKENLFSFEQFLLKANTNLLSDDSYREIALQNVFGLNINPTTSISLVDEVIRQMLLDVTLNIDYFVSFNRKDFEYACQLSSIIILE